MNSTDIYNLKYSYLKILLKGYGYSRVLGLNIGDEALDDETLLKSLNEMSNIGFIESDGKAFAVSEQIKKIVIGIGMSEKYVTIRSSNVCLGDMCCYTGDEVLVCRPDISSGIYFSACFTTPEGLFDTLWDGGYFPIEKEVGLPVEQSVIDEFEKKVMDNVDDGKHIGENSNVLFAMDLRNSMGEAEASLKIVEYFFYDYMVFDDGVEKQYEIFNVDTLKKQFGKLLS